MNDKNWEQIEPTFSLEEDRLRILKETLPEAFTDGKIDFETLKELLGEAVEDDEANEHFGLSWTGKREARKLAGMPSKGTLVPVEGKGLHEDTTENIFIEGDNLEVLKLLHKSYYGKIKMIYIDPPYNTGNDFIYKDDYKMPLESYLQRSGQMDEMDDLLTSNPKSSGRFHSDWLNMMYPRLRVAIDLLSKDGVIFVSIDDNEVHNLREMMGEIFGEENYISTVSLISNWKGRSDDKFIATAHEYILIFQKGEFESLGLPLSKKYLEEYRERDKDKGAFRYLGLRKRGANSRREDRPNLYYPIYANEETGEVAVKASEEFHVEILPMLSDGSDGNWRWGKETVQKRVEELFAKKVSGTERFDVFQKDYVEGKRIKPKSVWNDKTFSGEAGTLAYKAIMKNIKFSNPKSVEMLKSCVIQSTKESDIILDFFSGSGTTAQAIFEQNLEDGSNRKFICVQIGESIDEENDAYAAGFRKISDITAERIRRASKKIEKELDAGLPLEEKPDLGFKFYRLERSNFKAWSDYQGTDLDELRGLLESQVATSFVPDATNTGILTEILLLEGFPLDSEIEQDEDFERNTVWRVSSPFSEHRLFITLDDEVWEETISDSADLESNDIFICKDKSLSDENKMRLSDNCRLKVI